MIGQLQGLQSEALLLPGGSQRRTARAVCTGCSSTSGARRGLVPAEGVVESRVRNTPTSARVIAAKETTATIRSRFFVSHCMRLLPNAQGHYTSMRYSRSNREYIARSSNRTWREG